MEMEFCKEALTIKVDWKMTMRHGSGRVAGQKVKIQEQRQQTIALRSI